MTREYSSINSRRSGLGPTMDMSPFSTLTSWGSSSKCRFLMIRPTRVIRLSFLLASLAPSRSASTCMLRNLSIRKGLPPSVYLICL